MIIKVFVIEVLGDYLRPLLGFRTLSLWDAIALGRYRFGTLSLWDAIALGRFALEMLTLR